MIDSSKKIKACLQEAMDQRTKFLISLPEEITSVGGLDTSLSEFDDKYLYVEASSLNKFNPKWEKIFVTCFFKLVTNKKPRKETFLNFKSRLFSPATPTDPIILRLSFPDQLAIGQRRSSIRIEVNPRLILGFSMWDEDRFIRTTANGTQKKLHRPKVSIKDLESGFIKFMDLSAGGMKLKIFPDTVKDIDLNWKKRDTIIVWLVLSHPEKNDREQFWLKARICYKYEDFVSKEIDMGLEFINFGQINSDKKMQWLRVKDNNIEPIGDWTYKRYLEHYRQGII